MINPFRNQTEVFFWVVTPCSVAVGYQHQSTKPRRLFRRWI